MRKAQIAYFLFIFQAIVSSFIIFSFESSFAGTSFFEFFLKKNLFSMTIPLGIFILFTLLLFIKSKKVIYASLFPPIITIVLFAIFLLILPLMNITSQNNFDFIWSLIFLLSVFVYSVIFLALIIFFAFLDLKKETH